MLSRAVASFGLVPGSVGGWALAALFAVGLACSKDDETTGDRPEPPPAVVDAGLGEAGENLGCPSGPPRVGETCRRNPDVLDQICSYPMGSCMIEGVPYDNVEEYRCYEGTWHAWNTETNRCRMP